MLGFVRDSTYGVGLGGTALGLALGAEHPIRPAERTPRPPPRSHQSLFLTKPPREREQPQGTKSKTEGERSPVTRREPGLFRSRSGPGSPLSNQVREMGPGPEKQRSGQRGHHTGHDGQIQHGG